MLVHMFQFFANIRSRAPLDLDHLQAVFFDLDGTLIDVNMRRFVPGYLQRLTAQMQSMVDPELAQVAMHRSVAAMFANKDNQRTLETVLFDVLHDEIGMTSDHYSTCLDAFLTQDLEELKPLVTGHRLGSALIESARHRGWRVVLATNPIFPRAVVDARLSWGALKQEMFDYVTSYETAHFCKPNPKYFAEILEELQVNAGNCLMVGNDPLHDLAASQVGMRTCLLTEWRVPRSGKQFLPDWQGRHKELLDLFNSQPR